jgi:hypothetical protein
MRLLVSIYAHDFYNLANYNGAAQLGASERIVAIGRMVAPIKRQLLFT